LQSIFLKKIREEILMSTATPNIKFLPILSIMIILCLILSGCGILGVGSSGDDSDSQYTSQGQALEGDDSSVPPSDETGLEPVSLSCPEEVTEFFLFATHSWNFSPNRELDKMKVEGQTISSSACQFSVAGEIVIMEDCFVPITNTGFIQTDDGPCDITASGQAIISVEDAYCDAGTITLTIVETIDPDSGSGAMNCPNKSQEYFPFFPYSLTTREFPIKIGGADATESMDPDLSNQFMYNKHWSVRTAEKISPPPSE
jgi:hypothetical protein